MLSEVPHELSIPMRTPKSANGPCSNSFRPDSPSTTNFPRGRNTQAEVFDTGHGPFRALIVSNLKWGGPCRGHYVLPFTGVTICLKCAFLYSCRSFDISLPETHSGRDRVLPI